MQVHEAEIKKIFTQEGNKTGEHTNKEQTTFCKLIFFVLYCYSSFRTRKFQLII